eukprot:4110246-Amphidinium_carterae.1
MDSLDHSSQEGDPQPRAPAYPVLKNLSQSILQRKFGRLTCTRHAAYLEPMNRRAYAYTEHQVGQKYAHIRHFCESSSNQRKETRSLNSRKDHTLREGCSEEIVATDFVVVRSSQPIAVGRQ